ncbi:hypothetical protein [Sphingobacterium psychroaquaticum]|uniref:Uncharacterized protein n=1 Tax=Sphingobacterium psychroaquaticum TaxID=561061 RepID=A0A1X7JUA5_9SPHI|nr:hypothetical protein [Sphingobacterium psychroaquaticum]SMG31964.1 hypothetical protein SAMN05660862_2229 [Sphingobacterium psychroaquaticum]
MMFFFELKLNRLVKLNFVYSFAFMEKFILKLAQQRNPEVPFADYRAELTAQKMDDSALKTLFDKIQPSQKKHNSEIQFTACVLLLFSPKSILLSEKVENGVCLAIKNSLGVNQQSASYRIKVAREVYQVDRVFKHLVDGFVKEVKDE